MWIKICGNTTIEDARLAADCGADAVGFIFAPSPRQVTRAEVRAITAHLPAKLEKYGVFVDAEFDEIVATVLECGLTGVQLHSTPDAGLAQRLREHFSEMPQRRRLGILRVIHYGVELELQLEKIRQDHAVDAVLIDSRTATQVGGTGISYDWRNARASFFGAAPHLRLIAAGGLKPENVAEAIGTLQPWGVDVASGVEMEPGRKDAARVRAFFAAIRAAEAALQENPMPDVVT
jgi:phosphoribosylanthranilate isomerase